MTNSTVRARAGRKYPLVIYTMMINRWWPAIFALGLGLFGLAFAVYFNGLESWRWNAFVFMGGFMIVLSLVMLTIRRSAYIQPFSNHLRLVTPLLRMNISYKRLHKTSTTTMGALFPPRSVSKWTAGIIEPVAKMTAIVIDLYAYPVSRFVLQFFLSPLFFKDKTPHLVVLVSDWMKFSAELESMRVGGADAISSPQIKRDSSILSRLPREK